MALDAFRILAIPATSNALLMASNTVISDSSYKRGSAPDQPVGVVGYDELASSFEQLGVQPGDSILLHSSLSSLGYVAGGASTVIRALVDLLGPHGTLMAPYFIDYITRQELFDPSNPPPATTGAIPNCLAAWTGAMLSTSPSHPVVAVGRQAGPVLAGHHLVSPVGKDSPFDRLAGLGGKVLLLGVSQQANTTIHTGEALAPAVYWGMPRSDRPTGLSVRLPGGVVQWVHLNEIPGHSAGFDKIEPYLRSKEILRDGLVGKAACQLMSAQALINAVIETLGLKPDGLLCDLPGCLVCDQARQYLLKRGGLNA